MRVATSNQSFFFNDMEDVIERHMVLHAECLSWLYEETILAESILKESSQAT